MLIDRLYADISKKSFVCLGLDTSLSYVPEKYRKEGLADTIFAFNKEIIDATKDLVACYKLQIAYYEAMGLEGLKAYIRTLEYIKSLGIISIGDIKRSDISASAKEYARAHFEGEFETDIITLNPYMGMDSLNEYLPYLKKEKGIFVLLRTSNPGAKDIEYCDYKGRPLYYHIGDMMQEIAKNYMGTCGLSSFGFVVGGTHADEAEEIRKAYPQIPFLIPGYGAQGGKAREARIYLEDFKKGIVNSSRGIILAYRKKEKGEERIGECAREATLEMIRDIHGI